MPRKLLLMALAMFLLRMPIPAILSWHLIAVLRPVHQMPAIPFIHHAPVARKFAQSATVYSELIESQIHILGSRWRPEYWLYYGPRLALAAYSYRLSPYLLTLHPRNSKQVL